MNQYIIMGPQGSGKGTQAKMLAEFQKLVHIEVGDIFRWNIQVHTKLAARIKRTIEAGDLVPDTIVEQIVRERLDIHDWNYGFILDGFPRNKSQAEFYLESYGIDAVIYIDVPDDVVTQRALARRVCSQCGLDYNLIHHRPEVAGVCDVCGGTLTARDDDNEDALRQRLHNFAKQTLPARDLFERKGLVLTVDGQRTPEQVQTAIREGLGLASTPNR